MITVGTDSELIAALGCVGSRPLEIAVLSPVDHRKRGRSALRVVLEDGTTVKARRFESDRAAERNVLARHHLEPHFASVLGRSGSTIVEQWVAGVTLGSVEPTSAHVGAAALILAGLHDANLLDDGVISTKEQRDTALEHLRACESAGVISANQGRRLRSALHASDPGVTAVSLLHTISVVRTSS